MKNDSSGIATPGERSRTTRSSVVPDRLTPRTKSGAVTRAARSRRPPRCPRSAREATRRACSSLASRAHAGREPAAGRPRDRPAKSHRYEAASLRTRTEKRLTGGDLDALASELDVPHDDGNDPARAGPVTGAVEGAQPDLVRARAHRPAVHASEPDELALRRAELGEHPAPPVDEHHRPRQLVGLVPSR